MESYPPKYETLNSVSQEIRNEFEKYPDADSYFRAFATKMRDDKDFEANADQLTRVTRICFQDRNDDESRTKSFMIGALFGYNSLNKFNNPNTNKEVYEALNSLYADVRLSVKKMVEMSETDINESYREYLIAKEYNRRLKDDLCFDALNIEEMDLVYDMLSEMNADDSQRYDAMRGYLLIRSSLIWKEQNEFTLFKEALRSTDDKPEDLREFYEILADVEVNTDLADGKIDCEEEVDNVVEYFEELCSQYEITKRQDEDEIEKFKEKIEAKVAERFCEQQNLTFYKKFSISGKTLALIEDDDSSKVQFMTLNEDSMIEASIVDIEVRSIPSQRSVDKIYRMYDSDHQHNMKININPFGLVAILHEPVLYHGDGRITVFPESSTVYIPISYRDLKLHRYVYDEDPDEEDDYDEEDED